MNRSDNRYAANRFFAPTIQERSLSEQARQFDAANRLQVGLESARAEAIRADSRRADELMRMQKEQSAFDMASRIQAEAMQRAAAAHQQLQEGQAMNAQLGAAARASGQPSPESRRANLAMKLMQESQRAARNATGVDNTAIFGGAYLPGQAALAAGFGIDPQAFQGPSNPLQVGLNLNGGYVPTKDDILNARQQEEMRGRIEVMLQRLKNEAGGR